MCFPAVSVLTSVHPGFKCFLHRRISQSTHQLLSLLRCISQPTKFQTWVVPLLKPGIGRSNISVSGGSTPAQKVLDLRIFFLSFLITVVIHPSLTDLQRMLWHDSSVVSWPFRRLSVSLFFLFSSSLSLASRSFYNVDLAYAAQSRYNNKHV